MIMCIKGKITAAIKRANFLYFPLKYIVLIFNKSNSKKKKKNRINFKKRYNEYPINVESKSP